MTAMEAVRARSSARTFDGSPIDPSVVSALREAPLVRRATPGGLAPRVVVLDAAGARAAGSPGVRIGTYGLIREPACFLALVVPAGCGDGGLVDLGYRGEALVLEATAAGLGSCWLGGTFDRIAAVRAAGLQEGESVPALIAMGRPAPRRSLTEKAMRAIAGAGRIIDPASFAYGEGRDDGRFAPVLEAVARSPSASNRRPWRLAFAADSGETVDLYVERSEAYERAAGYRIQSIDAGIAALHAEIGAEAAGFRAERRTAPLRRPEGMPGGADFVLGWDLA